jgi:hypothetical protein
VACTLTGWPSYGSADTLVAAQAAFTRALAAAVGGLTLQHSPHPLHRPVEGLGQYACAGGRSLNEKARWQIAGGAIEEVRRYGG